jgi:hypothetical protein
LTVLLLLHICFPHSSGKPIQDQPILISDNFFDATNESVWTVFALKIQTSKVQNVDLQATMMLEVMNLFDLIELGAH